MYKGQSRLESVIESWGNVAIGYLIGLATQIVFFPIVGVEATIGENLIIACIFTVVSLIRSYFLRRLFNWLHLRFFYSSSVLYKNKGGFMLQFFPINDITFINREGNPVGLINGEGKFCPAYLTQLSREELQEIDTEMSKPKTNKEAQDEEKPAT